MDFVPTVPAWPEAAPWVGPAAVASAAFPGRAGQASSINGVGAVELAGATSKGLAVALAGATSKGDWAGFAFDGASARTADDWANLSEACESTGAEAAFTSPLSVALAS